MYNLLFYNIFAIKNQNKFFSFPEKKNNGYERIKYK